MGQARQAAGWGGAELSGAACLGAQPPAKR